MHTVNTHKDNTHTQAEHLHQLLPLYIGSVCRHYYSHVYLCCTIRRFLALFSCVTCVSRVCVCCVLHSLHSNTLYTLIQTLLILHPPLLVLSLFSSLASSTQYSRIPSLPNTPAQNLFSASSPFPSFSPFIQSQLAEISPLYSSSVNTFLTPNTSLHSAQTRLLHSSLPHTRTHCSHSRSTQHTQNSDAHALTLRRVRKRHVTQHQTKHQQYRREKYRTPIPHRLPFTDPLFSSRSHFCSVYAKSMQSS